MANPALDEDDEKPLDPAVENVRRKLVRFAMINLGLLLLALMAVVAAIVYKTRDTPPPLNEIQAPAENAMLDGDIPLPLGARVVSQSLSGNRLSLDVELADGSRTLFLYGISERRMIGRFRVTDQ